MIDSIIGYITDYILISTQQGKKTSVIHYLYCILRHIRMYVMCFL